MASLHLDCHGEWFHDDRLSSPFSMGSRGFLSLHELLGQRILPGGSLVFASACHSTFEDNTFNLNEGISLAATSVRDSASTEVAVVIDGIATGHIEILGSGLAVATADVLEGSGCARVVALDSDGLPTAHAFVSTLRVGVRLDRTAGRTIGSHPARGRD